MSAANSDVAETPVAAALLNSKRNCREAVSSSSKASSSSVATTPSSSSSSTTSGGGNCAYQASWCGGKVPSNTTEKPATEQCVFVKDYTALTISGGGGTVLINGTTCTGSNANCTASKPSASDGGYYIYVQTGAISSFQPYTVTAGTPVCNDVSPILLPQASFSNLSGAKVEVYNLQGKLVYSGYHENPSILKIPVQTKGIYIMRTTLGHEKKIQRLVVK
jgi:hypothetical protein